MPAVTFSNTAHTIRSHRVYVRRFWNEAWQIQEHLHCVEAVWSVAPSIPTAMLVWRFGDSIKQPAAAALATFDLKLIGKNSRYFVKIEFDTDMIVDVMGVPTPTKRLWVGTLEITEAQFGGVAPYYGEQVITCYGLERLLDTEPIKTTIYWDPFVNPSVGQKTTNIAHTFNRGGQGNMSPNVHSTYLFYPDLDLALKWNSRYIVEYLLWHHGPKDKDGGFPITINLAADANTIPMFDEPEIEQAGQTLYGLLDRIINRHRLLVWFLEYNDMPVNTVSLKVMTMASQQINLPGPLPAIIAANSLQLDWNFDADPLTSGAIKQSDIEKVEQVVCEGARRLSVCTLSIVDGTIEEAWEDSLETAYDLGASGESGYSNLSRADKQKRNSEVRDAPKLEDVYSKFTIPKAWDHKARNGENGGLIRYAVFPIDNPVPPPAVLPEPFPVYYPTMFIQQTSPLLVGVDYSGNKIETGSYTEPTKNREESGPLVLFKRPGTSRWVLGERIGDAAELEVTSDDKPSFSVYVNVINESQSIRIRVSGSYQHAIAANQFSKLADDPDPGGYNYGTMMVTVALPDDRHVMGVYPNEVPITPGLLIKKKYLDCGDSYRQIYVVPGTVVGIDVNGSPLRSTTGGYIPKPGDDDDVHRLAALAQIAYEWYGRTRYVMAVETYRMPDTTEINLGMLVTDVGTPSKATRRTINSIITQIQIQSPLGTGDDGDPCPSMRVVTWAGELDPIQLAPKYVEHVPPPDRYYGDEPRRIQRPQSETGGSQERQSTVPYDMGISDAW